MESISKVKYSLKRQQDLKNDNHRNSIEDLNKTTGSSFKESREQSKKNKQQQKTFSFNLSAFSEKKQKKTSLKLSNVKTESFVQHAQQPLNITNTMDKQEESKRKMIYGNDNFKQKQMYEDYTTTASNNNNIFQMVFLKKQEQISPPSSFNKSKVNLVEPPQQPGIKISDFDLGKKLGAGKFGQVFIARHRATGFLCALKKIDKTNLDSKLMVQLIRQIKIQIFLNHPNIVKMFTFFADKKNIYLGLQLCYSGQLYNFLKRKRKVPEDMTRVIVQQLCKALDFMHNNEIIHRDIKPQNVIYHCGLMKICDFGWSISTNTMRGTFCGTPLYVSPQLLKRKTYNNKIDIWSVGILTYQLLFGRVPFQITTEQDFMKIVEDQIKFSRATKVSNEAKQFIQICLQKDPRDRFTIPQLLQHPFLNHVENVSMAEMT